MSDINPAPARGAAGWQRGRPENSGPVDAALDAAVGNGTVLGVAAMGGTSKGLAYEGFFGKANAQAGTPMAPDTVFWLLSMTKTFTFQPGEQCV